MVIVRSESASATLRTPDPVPWQVYIAAVHDVHALVDRLREEWAMPGLKLHETAARGHHLVMPLPAGVSAESR